MQYAVLGKTNLRVSRLGFGCMRLPMKSDKEVDREKSIPMLRRAVELGVNYFDTAVGYCEGDSQRVLGEAMQGMRDKVVLSTKNHHYDKNDKKGWWKNLEDSLERLRTSAIDIYNFHGLNYESFERSLAGDDGLYKEVLKAKEQGMVRHICHSFHGSPESLTKCIDTGLFECITLQYNLLDRKLEGEIAHAAERGMGIVVMGPVGGGRLGLPSEQALQLIGGVKSTPELALRFVLSNPNVTVALSGMSTVQQLEENVETVSQAGSLTKEDHEKISAAVQERKELAGLYCTGCGYCMPCPEGVDIPANFDILNADRVFGLREHARSRYARMDGAAALCRLCGKCLELCPQKLDIPTRLSEALTTLDERSGSVTGWAELSGSKAGGAAARSGGAAARSGGAAARSGGTKPGGIAAKPIPRGMVSVDLRLFVKNFDEKPREKVVVELSPHGEDQVAPRRVEFSNLKPFGLRHRDISVTVRPPIETLSLDTLYSYDGSHSIEHLHYIVAAARKEKKGERGARTESGPYLHVPGPLHPASAASPAVKGHSFDFSVTFDSRRLTVWMDVEDDLLSVAKGTELREGIDHVRLYLDGRAPSKLGHRGRGEGVIHVTVYPSDGEDSEPIVKTSNKGDATAVVKRIPLGYRAAISVPLSSFLKDRESQGVIGFDIAQVSFDAKGQQTTRLSWTGRSGQEWDPSKMGRLLLPR